MFNIIKPDKKINRRVKILAVALLLICLVNAVFIKSAFANGHGKVILTVRQVFTGNGAQAPSGETFSYRLTPDVATNPMPEGGGLNGSPGAETGTGEAGDSNGSPGAETGTGEAGGANGSGGYTFTIAGTGETDVGPINFTRAGEYSYKLRHITGPRSGYTYDNEVYSLFINVTHDLTHTIVVYKNNGNKTADIKFEHSYRQYTSSGSKKPNVILPLERETTSEPATGDVLPYRRENKPSEPAQHTGDASPAPTEEPPLELTGPEQVEPYDPDWDIGDKNKPGDGTDVDRPPKAGDESRLELFTILLVLAGITAMISVVFLLTGRQRERVRREI